MLLTGCLKTSFRSRSKPGKNHTVQDEPYTVPNCTAPWHQSLLDEQSYDENNYTVCDSDERYSLYLLDYDFSQGGANMNKKKTGCMGEFAYTVFKYSIPPLIFFIHDINYDMTILLFLPSSVYDRFL